MFEGIQRSLSEALKKLRGRGRITEANIREAMQEVRKALLEADVNFTVAQDFIAKVTQRAVGQEVLRTLDPSEQIVKIVYDELVQLMGPVDTNIPFAKDRPTVIMLCGLQGQGKTTSAAKLALMLRERGRKPLLVAADMQRPAAVDQIKILGEQIGVPVFSQPAPATPVDVCRHAVAHAKNSSLDTVILDTAGRLHIDEMPMDELKQIDRLVRPDQVYMVCDAMTGQDGEKLDKLEPFRPEGMAQRILGRGDIMGLIEKVAQVQKELSQEEIAQQQKKLEEGEFTLDDFRKQFAQLKKMGPMKDVMASMPGMGDMIPEGEDPEDAFRHIQGMIDSMTKEERRNPDVIDINRRRRIASGSGVEPHDIKQFLGQFEQVRDLMRKMAKMSIWERIKMVTGLGKAGAFQPGSKMAKAKGDTGHRKSPKERAKERKNKKKKR
jgi:signal recognition particle subunit SRP54